MLVRLLGRVIVESRGAEISVRRAQSRGVLALLALHQGRVVQADTIIDGLWGGAQPSTARAQVASAVCGIRRHMVQAGSGGALWRHPAGYVLDSETIRVDVREFNRLWVAARHHEDPKVTVSLLRAALSLWRGAPLSNAAGAFIDGARAELVWARLDATECLARAWLRLDNPIAAMAALSPLLAEHPHRHSARGAFMLALYRMGRDVEAIDGYFRYRRALADELGTEPARELVDLVEAMIRHEPWLDAETAVYRT